MPTRHDDAQFLTEWKRTYGLTDRECAEWCELSVSAFRRQRRGETTAARMRQTVKLARVYPVHFAEKWLDIALAAADVARTLTKRPLR